MTKIEKALLSLASTIVVFTLGFMFMQSMQRVEASVPIGNEYQSTTTRSAWGGVPMVNLTVISTGQGALGSVVITGAGTGVMNIYDATSTVNNAQWATTTLASFPVSAAAGTYTFDAIYRKGLLVEIVGASAGTATSTITYR